MKTYIHWLLPLFFIGLTSCGEQSEEQATTEQVERSEQKQNIFSNKEKIEGIFGGNVDMKPIEFQKLKILLPTQLSDMKRVSSKGNSIDQFGMKFSEAKAEYRSKDRYRRLTIKITDTIAAPLMKLGLSWISGQMENESDNSYEKTITYNGHKGLEAYNRQYQKGKLHWIVEDRYLVELRGRNLSIEIMKQLGEQINFDQLNSPNQALEKSDSSDEKNINPSNSDANSIGSTITASKVAAGMAHACKIKADNTLSCWGGNDFGQTNVPNGTFTQVSSGAFHNCAIKKDNSIVCWGLNSQGQIESPNGNYIQVSAGIAITCAVKSDSSLVCWGDVALTNSPTGTFTQVSAGGSHSCAIRTNGKLICWGDNSFGQIEAPKGIFTQVSSGGGGDSCAIRHDRKLICWGKGLVSFGAELKKKSKDKIIWQAGPPSGNFTQVSVGTHNSCAIKVDGMLECWGLKLGKTSPPKVAFTQVSVGMGQICGVRVEGITGCWGHLAALSKPVKASASPVSIATPLEALASLDSGFAATKHICGLKSDGTLSCWGNNEYEESTPPKGHYTQVSAGGNYSCAIKTDKTLICWGNNDVGQANPPEGPFKQVTASGSTTCGIRSDGTIACWGVRNSETVPPQGIFDQISTGSGNSCAIKPGGDLVCWGKGLTGVANPPDGVYSQVSMGVFHNCALKVDGTIACWGDDCCGETIPPKGAFVQVTTGYNHTCGIMTDGFVKCWGTKPQINPSNERFIQIRAGKFFTCGIKVDGQLSCWGSSADSLSYTSK